MKIGVFDSGIGGLSVANAIEAAVPQHEVVFRNDSENVPYGSKTPEQLLLLVVPILEDLVAQGCDLIVVACNTVSTTLINELRNRFSVPLIAIEPMVKPAAALTKTGIIAVCATPATLASARYNSLKQMYASGITVLEPDCSDWARMIESSEVDTAKVQAEITSVLDGGADVIVLGCTHFHWIAQDIRELAGDRAVVMHSEVPVIAQLKRLLQGTVNVESTTSTIPVSE